MPMIWWEFDTFVNLHYLAINSTNTTLLLPGHADGFLGLCMPIEWDDEKVQR